MVELGFLPFVIPWMAVRAITRAMFAAPDIIFRRPFDVVGDEQIQPAILVVVEPSGTGRPSAQVGDSGFFGDVGKGPIAIVVIKDGAAVTRDVNIWEAVVVVVADGNTLAVMSFSAESGFFGYVRKCAITIAMVKRGAQRLGRLVDISGR